jgi:VWFA-related protein
VVLVLAGLPILAQVPGSIEYAININSVLASVSSRHGKTALYVTAQFKILHGSEGKPVTELGPDERIVVEEDQRPVAELELFQPRTTSLTTVLAVDISGSMGRNHKIESARQAAGVFLDRLAPRADCGLILFDHKMRVTQGLAKDPARQAAHRAHLRELIQAAQPTGGTASLDATLRAIEMLHGVAGHKAVVLLTDGVDLNSTASLKEVVAQARKHDVRIYTVGVGEPGSQAPVTTVLVLDHSGSMARPAEAGDELTKIQALHRAAGRFVDAMRPTAQTTLLPFSSRVERPEPFSNNKAALKTRVERLDADGGTLLYDAAFDAIELLEAARPEGKRAVVVLTDGVDEAPGSRHRVDEVIERARETKVPLYMLGLGRPVELNEHVMQRMARESGGKYYHSSNQQALIDVFENLSIELHDDGVDVPTLTQLAEKTGGKYFPASDVSRLPLIYQELAEELQSNYTVIFPSRRSSHDGTARGIDIRVKRGDVLVSQGGSADYHVSGLIVPELDQRVYLGFLVFLGCLLSLPAGLRRLYRLYGGT